MLSYAQYMACTKDPNMTVLALFGISVLWLTGNKEKCSLPAFGDNVQKLHTVLSLPYCWIEHNYKPYPAARQDWKCNYFKFAICSLRGILILFLWNKLLFGSYLLLLSHWWTSHVWELRNTTLVHRIIGNSKQNHHEMHSPKPTVKENLYLSRWSLIQHTSLLAFPNHPSSRPQISVRNGNSRNDDFSMTVKGTSQVNTIEAPHMLVQPSWERTNF